MACSRKATTGKSRDAAKALSDVGTLHHLNPEERNFIKATIKQSLLFSDLPKPADDDWLSEHQEAFQSYSQWKGKFEHVISREHHSKNVIYLVPLDDKILNTHVDTDGKGKMLKFITLLQSYAEAFFRSFKVKVLDIKRGNMDFKSRIHCGRKQFLISDICQFLKAKFPKDAYCVVGITMTDIYPQESWNFVFGQAHPSIGIGIFSFARYDPAFYLDARDEGRLEGAHASVVKGDCVANFTNTLVLWRSCKVMVHEICHLFCLSHCIYFSCAMNGSNHLEEATRRPMFLCPVCLVKLKSVCGSTCLKDRYLAMMDFFQKINSDDFIAASHWVETVLETF